jgi:hypothetical protein
MRLCLVVVVLVAGLLAALLAGCGGQGSRSIDARVTVTTTAAGTVIARATDSAHGLIFELETSPRAQKTFPSVA